MAAYTFSLLSENDRQAVIRAANEVAQTDFRQPLAKIAQQHGPVVTHNFLAYGFRQLGIRPALGNSLWFHVSNPFIASIGADELIGFTKRQLEREYHVQLPDLD